MLTFFLIPTNDLLMFYNKFLFGIICIITIINHYNNKKYISLY